MNHGKSVEDFVEHLCNKSFFADFTFRSPEYIKQGGQRKEAADLLVVFNDTLLAIQVKSKEVDATDGEIASVILKRIWTKVEEATSQFRAIAEALNNPDFKSFQNGRGVTVNFEKHKITEIIFVIVFAPIWKNAPPEGMALRFAETCLPDADIAVHLFTMDEFSILLTMLDTLPDFVFYLNARWMLHRHKLIPPKTDPMDEWAFVTFERPKVAKVLENKTFIDLTGLGKQHAESLSRLEEEEKPSYLIDRLIELLNLGIGLSVPIYKKLAAKTEKGIEPGSLEAYRRVIPYLAKLNRDERRRLGEQFLLRVSRCKQQPLSFGGLKFDKHEEAYVVLASKWSQRNRQVALYSVSATLGHKLNVKTVIGIAGSAEQPVLSPSEAMVMDVSDLGNNPTLVKASEILFGSISAQEY